MNNFGIIQKIYPTDRDSVVSIKDDYTERYRKAVEESERRLILFSFVEQRYKNIFGNKYRN